MTVDLSRETLAAADRATLKRQFDNVHQQRYGTCAPDERAEIVSLRATVAGLLDKPPVEPLMRRGGTAAPRGRREVFFAEAGGLVATPVFWRDALAAGERIVGPALIEEHASTTVVLPGDILQVDRLGNLDIASGGRA